MTTYPLNTSVVKVETVVAQLTAKGRETMRAVGNRETSYFDEGIVKDSGIWGECLTSELGHRSSGIINRLRDLGLWEASEQQGDDPSMWWSLTALGADVANYLAGNVNFKEECTCAADFLASSIHSEGCPRWTEPILGPVAEETEEIPETVAKPMTKTEAYEMVKQARVALRNVDYIVYRERGKDFLRSQLEDALRSISTMLEALDGPGINGAK
jgi:hypothetical protein